MTHRPWTCIDLFAGAGGASEGIRLALGAPPVVAINHNPLALAMHAKNHPTTRHLVENVCEVEIAKIAEAVGPIDLLWASPDCKDFSRAKGGKPRDREIRSLAWVVVDWAEIAKPRIICLENVMEFLDWGPLDDEGNRITHRKGEEFREFVKALQRAGYAPEWRVLSTDDYGVPQRRRRLFLIARRDGVAIRWPEPTHGHPAEPHRPAADCMEWTIPIPSIFTRKRGPHAPATQARIAEGLRRYVLNTLHPFVVRVDGGLIAPGLIQTSYGERKGQRPRALDLFAPLGTVVAGGGKHALFAAFLAKHYGGVVGQDMERPLGTVTGKDHHSVCAAYLTKFYGTSVGSDLREPMPTITAGGNHLGLVSAWFTNHKLGTPEITVGGERYCIHDLGMRMLAPRELARAQSFHDGYVLEGTQTQQIDFIGNAAPPLVVSAIVSELARAA